MADKTSDTTATDTTIAGGVYEDAAGAGTFHDAQGRAVSKDGKLLKGDDVPGAVNADDEAWRADMAKQREASASEAEPEAPKARKRG